MFTFHAVKNTISTVSASVESIGKSLSLEAIRVSGSIAAGQPFYYGGQTLYYVYSAMNSFCKASQLEHKHQGFLKHINQLPQSAEKKERTIPLGHDPFQAVVKTTNECLTQCIAHEVQLAKVGGVAHGIYAVSSAASLGMLIGCAVLPGLPLSIGAVYVASITMFFAFVALNAGFYFKKVREGRAALEPASQKDIWKTGIDIIQCWQRRDEIFHGGICAISLLAATLTPSLYMMYGVAGLAGLLPFYGVDAGLRYWYSCAVGSSCLENLNPQALPKGFNESLDNLTQAYVPYRQAIWTALKCRKFAKETFMDHLYRLLDIRVKYLNTCSGRYQRCKQLSEFVGNSESEKDTVKKVLDALKELEFDNLLLEACGQDRCFRNLLEKDCQVPEFNQWWKGIASACSINDLKTLLDRSSQCNQPIYIERLFELTDKVLQGPACEQARWLTHQTVDLAWLKHISAKDTPSQFVFYSNRLRKEA